MIISNTFTLLFILTYHHLHSIKNTNSIEKMFFSIPFYQRKHIHLLAIDLPKKHDYFFLTLNFTILPKTKVMCACFHTTYLQKNNKQGKDKKTPS